MLPVDFVQMCLDFCQCLKFISVPFLWDAKKVSYFSQQVRVKFIKAGVLFLVKLKKLGVLFSGI